MSDPRPVHSLDYRALLQGRQGVRVEADRQARPRTPMPTGGRGMTRIYISGPIAGYPGDNRAAFDTAAAALAGVGHLTINPFEVPVGVEHPTWADYLRADLLALMFADGVATLPGWQESRGASLEVHVAKALGIPVKPLDAWLTDGDDA